MLVAEHESLVTQVEKLADPQFQSDSKDDRLSDLSYGAPPRTSSGLSFHGRVLPGTGLVDQRDPVLPIDENGDPGWKGRIRHADDGVDEGNEAYRGGVRKAVHDV